MHALDPMLAMASKGEFITLQSENVLFKAGETCSGSTMFAIGLLASIDARLRGLNVDVMASAPD